eukprot:2547779-Prymnesium_polylepis.1
MKHASGLVRSFSVAWTRQRGIGSPIHSSTSSTIACCTPCQSGNRPIRASANQSIGQSANGVLHALARGPLSAWRHQAIRRAPRPSGRARATCRCRRCRPSSRAPSARAAAARARGLRARNRAIRQSSDQAIKQSSNQTLR